jgi:hypothetical protein
MKHLINTTAIVTLLAFPLAAQESGQTGAQTETQSAQAASSALQAGQLEIQASSLIGQRLYIMRDPGESDMQQGEAMQPATGTEGQAAGASPEVPAAEGEQTQQAEGQQPATDGQETEQAQQQPPASEGQQTEQAQGQAPAAQPSAGTEGAMSMAELEQGVSELPDNWTMAGEIDDVLLSADGQVEALIVDAGGFLGMNDSTRRIDLQQVAFVPDLDNEGEFYVVYTGDRATIEQAEAFDPEAVTEGTLRGSETFGDEIRGEQSDVAFTSLTSEDLVGTAVYGADDNWVGEISELALTESGDVEAVVVDVGGFLGIGQKPVALSMDQIQLRRGEGGMFRDDLRAYVNATQEELESLPQWEDDAG